MGVDGTVRSCYIIQVLLQNTFRDSKKAHPETLWGNFETFNLINFICQATTLNAVCISIEYKSVTN